MKHWLRKLESNTIKISDSKWIKWIILIVNIGDSTVLPAPTTPFFLSVSFLNRRNTKQYAMFALAGTIAGSTISFIAGHLVCMNPGSALAISFKTLFDWIPGFSSSGYARFHMMFSKWNFLVFFIISLTSAPFGLFAFLAGALKLSFTKFIIATILSQGIRFTFLVMITNGLASRLKLLVKQLLRPDIKPFLRTSE